MMKDVTKALRAGVLMSVLLSVLARGTLVVIPGNVVVPHAAGEVFSFDLVVSDPMGASARAFQGTMSVDSGLSFLNFDDANSKAVVNSSGYWLYSNSSGANAFMVGDSNCRFADSTLDAQAHPLSVGHVMGRYCFVWDGTAGDYVFSINLESTCSFMQDENFNKQPLQFDPGPYQSVDEAGFMIYLPEPAAIVLFGLAGLFLWRRRRFA